MSPTARSLKFLRDSRYTADVAERFLPQVNRKRDLFGCFDLIGVRRGVVGALGVQATTRGHIRDRLLRIKQRPALAVWLAAGNRAEVHGWYQNRAGRWHVERVELRGDDLAEVPIEVKPRTRRRRQERSLFDALPVR